MKLESLVRLCFPEPPTPMSIVLPLGCLKTLDILNRWSIASSKKMSFYWLLPSKYSSCWSSKTFYNFWMDLISSYSLPKSSLSKSPNLIPLDPNIWSFSILLLKPRPNNSIIRSMNQSRSSSFISLSWNTRELSWIHSRIN
jgi:hypothetical protein